MNNDIKDSCRTRRGCHIDWFKLPHCIDDSCYSIIANTFHTGVFSEGYDTKEILHSIKSVLDKDREERKEDKKEDMEKSDFEPIRIMLILQI